MNRCWQLVGALAVTGACFAAVTAQEEPPRRGGEPPATRGAPPRAVAPRGEDRPRSGEPGIRRPPLGPGFPPGEFGGPPGPEGPPGPRSRGVFRGPPEGRFLGEPTANDPEMAALIRQDAELEQQTIELVQRIQQWNRQSKPSEEVGKAKEELKELVTRHFDVRQKRRELQIQRLQEELKRLQEAVAKRNESRDEIIKKRLADLSRQPDDLGF